MFRHWGPGSKNGPLVLATGIDFQSGLLEPVKQKILGWIYYCFLWYWLSCSHIQNIHRTYKTCRAVNANDTSKIQILHGEKQTWGPSSCLSAAWGTSWKPLFPLLLLLLLCLLKVKYFSETSRSEFHCVLRNVSYVSDIHLSLLNWRKWNRNQQCAYVLPYKVPLSHIRPWDCPAVPQCKAAP